MSDHREEYERVLGLERVRGTLVTTGGICSPVEPVYTLVAKDGTELLFPQGSFLHLDAGKLDLGIVRDSVLQSAENDFEVFGETFE